VKAGHGTRRIYQKPIDDLTGKRFGKLSVRSFSHTNKIGKKAGIHWNVACDCGIEKTVTANKLKTGNTKSCGCAAKNGDAAKERARLAREDRCLRGKKICSGCKQDLPLEDFPVRSRSQDRRHPSCSVCTKEKRTSALYGVGSAWKTFVYAQQKGVCAICTKPFSFDEARVDHCHSTNLVRGLLCNTCNLALGLLGDSVENAKRLIEYVTKNECPDGVDEYGEVP
jgi:hypothetical protein